MLMSLDQFVFSIKTAPFHELKRRRNWKHPKKSRIGARDSSQYTGLGEDTITLDGLVAPYQIGSIASIDKLSRMADFGDAYVLVDGAGNIYGAYTITSLDETQRYHTRTGIPRRIEFTLTLERVDDGALRIEQNAVDDDETEADGTDETDADADQEKAQ
ncbi:oxidoreductase [Burkholderia ubonensis]|uniref:phage tail protein n=1 Tax=Burkholderia ubonensis TaxID=101571 RepID=UPI00075E78E0|nr:phage tail protein [Burkholderia ubonensis]KVX12198.1 oxidoreductase [Burkholderia ubonensis]